MSNVPDLVARLTVALDGLAQAMESGDPDAVLAAEAPIATAVGALRSADLGAIVQHPDARRIVLDARLALARCRTLGHAAAGLAAVVASRGYGPSGYQLQPEAPASNVISRT